jgi:hypothetical protein
VLGISTAAWDAPEGKWLHGGFFVTKVLAAYAVKHKKSS